MDYTNNRIDSIRHDLDQIVVNTKVDKWTLERLDKELDDLKDFLDRYIKSLNVSIDKQKDLIEYLRGGKKDEL